MSIGLGYCHIVFFFMQHQGTKINTFMILGIEGLVDFAECI